MKACVTIRSREAQTLLWGPITIPPTFNWISCWSMKGLLVEQPLHLSSIFLGLAWYYSRILFQNYFHLAPHSSGHGSKYSANFLPDFLSLLLSACSLWILIWLPHSYHFKCLTFVLWQWSGIMPWSYHEINGQSPITPVCTPLHVQFWTWRCYGLVGPLWWVFLLSVPP